MLIRPLILAAILLQAVTAFGQAPKLKMYKSQSGRFQALMPGKVKEESSRTNEGLKKYTANVFDNQILYLAAVEVYRELKYDKETTDSIRKSVFEAVRKQRRQQSATGELLTNHEHTQHGYPALSVTIKSKENGGIIIRNRVFFDGSRVYRVMAGGPKELVNQTAVTSFLNSVGPLEKKNVKGNAAMDANVAKMLDLVNEKTALEKQFGKGHPSVLSIEKKIEKMWLIPGMKQAVADYIEKNKK